MQGCILSCSLQGCMYMAHTMFANFAIPVELYILATEPTCTAGCDPPKTLVGIHRSNVHHTFEGGPLARTRFNRTNHAMEHTQQTNERVGWVGLGSMGAAMAGNLSASLLQPSSIPLLVYNRDGSKCAPLVAAGAEQCPGLQQLAEAASAVIMMLANDEAVNDVVHRILQHPGRIKVLVDCSTVAPATTARAAAQAATAGISYVAAPVFGRPDAAAAAQLLVIAAGPQAAVDRVMPYLQALGRKVSYIGDQPEKANVLKLAGNFSIVGIIEIMGEAMAVCERSGLSREQYLEFVRDFYPAPPIVGYATRIARDELEAGKGFTVDLALKDVGHMRSLAKDTCCPLPLADLAFNNLLTAKALGYGQSDWGALALASRHAAGLALPVLAPPGDGSSSGDKKD